RHIGEETSERYEYVPAQLLVIEDVCKKYAYELVVSARDRLPGAILANAALYDSFRGKLAAFTKETLMGCLLFEVFHHEFFHSSRRPAGSNPPELQKASDQAPLIGWRLVYRRSRQLAGLWF